MPWTVEKRSEKLEVTGEFSRCPHFSWVKENTTSLRSFYHGRGDPAPKSHLSLPVALRKGGRNCNRSINYFSDKSTVLKMVFGSRQPKGIPPPPTHPPPLLLLSLQSPFFEVGTTRAAYFCASQDRELGTEQRHIDQAVEIFIFFFTHFSNGNNKI